MKKLINIIFSFSFILIIASCNEFLEEVPRNQISTDQYFNKPEDVTAAVNALYGIGALAKYNTGDFQREIMLGGYMSGLFDNERTERFGPYEANNLLLNRVNMDEYMYNWWSRAYDAISKANTAIKYIPEVEDISVVEANKLMAEAMFYRAYNYFCLVKDFGDVPLITEPYESLENIYVSRTPSAQVYEQIITDLNWALANGGLADVPFSMNGYRITKGLINTVLADVYLQKAGYPLQEGQGSYGNAADAARMVIASGQYELIENGPTPEESAYNVMRTSNVEREYIFSYEFDAQLRSNNYPGWTVPAYAKPPSVIIRDVWIIYRPLIEFINVYDPALDLRIQNKQLWHNKVEVDGEVYDFQGNWAPYLWYDEEALYETGRGSMNLRIYRFAEVLLIAAEAIAQSEGVTIEAVSYLTDVRSRAYNSTDRSEIESELAGLSKEQFIKEVWKERLRELPLNFKIWSDIQRTRLYPVTSASNPGEVNFVDVVGHTNPFDAVFEEHHLLYPMSTRVLNRNPELTPNGY